MSDGVIPTLVVIGPPGAGKTTVGRLAARTLELPFVDTDEAIRVEQSTSIAEIFVEQGEPAFRALEADAVECALQRSGVIAVGGGAPMTMSVASLLELHRVVFLSVAIATDSRVEFDNVRPLLAVNPRSAWKRLIKERRSTYERLATWVVDTTGRSVEDVVVEVVQKVRES